MDSYETWSGDSSNYPQEQMSRPQDLALIVSSLLQLDNESAIPEVMMNCVFEAM